MMMLSSLWLLLILLFTRSLIKKLLSGQFTHNRSFPLVLQGTLAWKTLLIIWNWWQHFEWKSILFIHLPFPLFTQNYIYIYADTTHSTKRQNSILAIYLNQISKFFLCVYDFDTCISVCEIMSVGEADLSQQEKNNFFDPDNLQFHGYS